MLQLEKYFNLKRSISSKLPSKTFRNIYFFLLAGMISRNVNVTRNINPLNGNLFFLSRQFKVSFQNKLNSEESL